MQIKGIEFVNPAAPFKTGHVLDENQAAALNQTWFENIRNNLAKQVEAEQEKAKAEGREPNVKALQKMVDEYAATYIFNPTRGGDPVETLAMKLARDVVRKNLRERGVKAKDTPPEEIDRLATKLIADNPRVREVAKKQVDEANKLKNALNV